MSRRPAVTNLRAALVVAVLASVLAVPPVPSLPATAGGVTSPSQWQTWILSSADQFRVGPPPGQATTEREIAQLLRLQEDRTRAVRRRIRFWNNVPGTFRWTKLALDMIVKHRPGAFPTRSARLLALLHVGMYDAMVAAYDSRDAHSRRRPYRVDDRLDPFFEEGGSSYPDPRSAIAGAAEVLLAYLFPNEPVRTFEDLADEAIDTRLWAGVNYRSDVREGRRIGHRVANVIIDFGAVDGTQTNPQTVLANRLCSTPNCAGADENYWQPTAPSFQYPPTDPATSVWVPLLMDGPDQFRPGLPPAYGSAQFLDGTEQVKEANDNSTPEDLELAFFWDDGPGTSSPAGHWNLIALDLVRSADLNTQRTARIFALMNAAIRDAFISVWDAKYAYWNIRPVTVIRERPTILGQANPVYDPGWLPNVVTPPFPSYPSGHVGESAAAARVLQHLFPEPGQPPISGEPEPQGGIDELAEEVGLARLVGGIHYPIDNSVALVMGRGIGGLAIARAESDGSGL